MSVSEYDLEVRSTTITEARREPLLDGVFSCCYYNWVIRKWGPGAKPEPIDISDVFPEMSRKHADALDRRCYKMFRDANYPAMARLGYSQGTMNFEEALEAFKKSNPGFSEKSYGMAIHAGCINNR